MPADAPLLTADHPLPVAWADARRILCVRLDGMGDLLMTTPALRAARGGSGHLTMRHITLLASPAGAVTAHCLPEVDAVLTCDAPWVKATAPRASSDPEFAMIEQVRAGAFDAAIIFTVCSQNPLPTAMLTMLAGILLRRAYRHETPYQLLSEWVPDPDPDDGIRHEVRRQLDLVASVGYTATDDCLAFAVPAHARANVAVSVAAPMAEAEAA